MKCVTCRAGNETNRRKLPKAEADAAWKKNQDPKKTRKDFEYAQLPDVTYEEEPTKAPCGCDEEEVLLEG